MRAHRSSAAACFTIMTVLAVSVTTQQPAPDNGDAIRDRYTNYRQFRTSGRIIKPPQ